MIYVFFQSGDYIGSLVTYSTMIGEYGVYPNRVSYPFGSLHVFYFFYFYICNNASFNKIENIQRSKAHRQCTIDRNNKTSKLRCMERRPSSKSDKKLKVKTTEAFVH